MDFVAASIALSLPPSKYDAFERAGFGWRELIELDGDEGMRRVASALKRLASLDFF